MSHSFFYLQYRSAFIFSLLKVSLITTVHVSIALLTCPIKPRAVSRHELRNRASHVKSCLFLACGPENFETFYWKKICKKCV